MSLKNSSAVIKIPKYFKDKLNDKIINKIYQRFEKSLKVKDSFAVAVSGGPDSLALAFLAKVYSIKNKIVSKYFIIDHKLRDESTKEARLVKRLLKKNFIDSDILTWNGKKPSKNIQSLARNKRYELIFNRCNKLEINNILLGHHQDDLIENFLIRLIRGSGLKGLVSLEKNSKIENKNLLRPLLDERKEDLILLTKKIFNFYIQDPSNIDKKFQRIKVRNLVEELKKDGLDKKKFLKTINNLKSSNRVINFYKYENILKNSYISPKNDKIILNIKFFYQPYEIIFRSLSDLIKIIGKKYYAVRGKKLDKIITDIRNNQLSKVTLGGCFIEKVNQTVIILKEH